MKRIEIEASGGCQCGGVRYHASAMLDTSHVCHCRMCQKAAGNYFAALVGVPRDALTWTRGTPATFKSSDPVERGFCRDCGTPLYYDYRDAAHLSVTTGSLDEPARFPPKRQFGVEARLPWIDIIPALQADGSTEELMTEEAAAIRASNHQHPDHDTDSWPSGAGKKPGTSR
ncbi:GFA family protein [Sphingopyxis sp. GW247-27LB]|uniref:GFA family protein n=1 Tax=Sphingopyxis sp. GW247-27LB TaxID=2012632 RepID=UPI000BA5A024|nr:GFA family protein [Sphingopyxis sp. GW247-27LB]PAL22548.1 aldehyde-activating protein [Sphingopyxis sp. GW247-27LB]